MQNRITNGIELVVTAPSGGLTAGQVHVQGSAVVVVQDTVAEGEQTVGHRVGTFTLAKTAGQAWTQGVKVYLITATGVWTTSASGNANCGAVAAADAASADTTAPVSLSGEAIA